jgi:DNA polymerase elongation subunit (family B)
LYRKIYYNSQSGKIHIWETINGKRLHDVVEQPIEYYVVDPSGESELHDIYGNCVKKQVSNNPEAIKQLTDSGVKCYETDIPEVTKFIQKRYANTQLKPDVSIFKIAFIDIELESGNRFSDPRISADCRINMITLKLKFGNKILVNTWGLKEYTGDKIKNYVYCADEDTLLTDFMTYFKKAGVDIITGWNVSFDIRYIIERLKFNEIEMSLSPINQIYIDHHDNIFIAGIIIFDYLAAYKEFVRTPLPNYSLQSVSTHEIKQGKIELDGGVNQIYKTDWNKFAEYNVNDVELVYLLDQKLKLIELAITFAYQALIPIDRVFSTIAILTGYLIKYLHKNNMVLSDRSKSQNHEEYPGAFCSANPGYYENVISFDIVSMYPSLMIQRNISPETLVYLSKEDYEKDKSKFPNLIITPITTMIKREYIEDGKKIKKDVEYIVCYKRDKVGILLN